MPWKETWRVSAAGLKQCWQLGTVDFAFGIGVLCMSKSAQVAPQALVIAREGGSNNSWLPDTVDALVKLMHMCCTAAADCRHYLCELRMQR